MSILAATSHSEAPNSKKPINGVSVRLPGTTIEPRDEVYWRPNAGHKSENGDPYTWVAIWWSEIARGRGKCSSARGIEIGKSPKYGNMGELRKGI